MILADCHTHTAFSSDSDTPVEAQIDAAVAAGLDTICITDHTDPGFPDPTRFCVDPAPYLKTLSRMQDLYRGRIRSLAGMEVGLYLPAEKEVRDFLGNRDSFDFFIGSTHLVDGMDPWEAAFWQIHEGTSGYQLYFETQYENVCHFDGFDVCGHLDYISRYGRRENRPYDARAYRDLIDATLKVLIEKGLGLECNAAGMTGAPGNPNPEADILRRYRELGGEILTIGSDGHTTDRIAYRFHELTDYLTACGFRYYTVFEQHRPVFLPL